MGAFGLGLTQCHLKAEGSLEGLIISLVSISRRVGTTGLVTSNMQGKGESLNILSPCKELKHCLFLGNTKFRRLDSPRERLLPMRTFWIVPGRCNSALSMVTAFLLHTQPLVLLPRDAWSGEDLSTFGTQVEEFYSGYGMSTFSKVMQLLRTAFFIEIGKLK